MLRCLRPTFVLPLLTALLVAGCANSTTVASRKSERAAAYAGLPDDMKTFVDDGRIKIGMPADAVYIAWGKPAQILQNESEAGSATVWIYEGGYLEETRYWSRRTISHDYQPRTYVRAEAIFVDGKVKSWHTLPQPVY